MLVSAPHFVNACLATSRIRSRFRCASARGLRLADLGRFMGILKKNLQPETVSGNLLIRRHSPYYRYRAANGRKKDTMGKQTKLGGTFTLPGTSTSLHRMGYGAMQLAGPEVWGPPRDVNVAIEVLREAVADGVNHIDTSDYYGPHITNQIIKKALH